MFNLSIVTPEQIIFEGQIYSLYLPGGLGYLEILSHHAPLITLVHSGKLIITDKDRKKWLYHISGGVLEFSNNQGTLLADEIEFISQLQKQIY